MSHVMAHACRLISAALPATVASFLVLGAHEAGHALAAGRRGMAMGPPLFIPAGLGLLGSFGAITQTRGVVPNRETLTEVGGCVWWWCSGGLGDCGRARPGHMLHPPPNLHLLNAPSWLLRNPPAASFNSACASQVAAAGPLAGAAVSAVLAAVGLAMTLAGVGGVDVDTASFKDSLLAGAVAQAAFGDRLFGAASVNCNPLLVAGWAGLIVNAINMVPAGEYASVR
jgi:membrane-associated protease RseP (regulator of RpoE activity)